MKIIDFNENRTHSDHELARFKFRKIAMEVEDDCLSYKIISPYINSNNYVVRTNDGILNIAFMVDDLIAKRKRKASFKKRFFQVFLIIPKSGFNTLKSIFFENGTLHFTIIKDAEIEQNELIEEPIIAIA